MLLREMAMSPSVFKNNEPKKSPMTGKIVAGLQNIQGDFQNKLLMNLVLRHQDAFRSVERDGEQSGEFDDEVYERLKTQAQTAAEMLGSQLEKVVKEMWKRGHEAD